jgi:hypothetical protein
MEAGVGADVEAGADTSADVEVEVGLLGPIQIRGASRSFVRPWALDLVAYLAMHPQGAANDVWATALWPDREMAPATLHSIASTARRVLGQSETGADHLPRSHGRLRLSATVGTDWDRFCRLSGQEEPGAWRRGLSLVRGRPFDGLRATDWTVLEGVAATVEVEVADLAVRLSTHCLEAGDTSGAEWAARRGLLASPFDEPLYRMLLRAADLAGNPARVELVIRELVHRVGDGGDGFDSVHPATLELYRELSRHRTWTVRRAG